MFLNELDRCCNNDVIEKTFYNAPRGILRVKVETYIISGEGFEPGVNEAPANQADLADQFFQLVTLSPAFPAVRPGILPRLSLDLLSIGVFEEGCKLRAELGQMIEQLCICKIVRSRNVWVLIDGSDPGLENLLPMREHKIAKPDDCWDRRRFLAVTSDERNPPNLISEVKIWMAVGQRIITTRTADVIRADLMA
jgi:hypothetical protein